MFPFFSWRASPSWRSRSRRTRTSLPVPSPPTRCPLRLRSCPGEFVLDPWWVRRVPVFGDAAAAIVFCVSFISLCNWLSRGYLLVHTNGGLNQMRAGISDIVAVARILNATLIIPELDKKSFWHDRSNFSDVFDEEHFINSLANDVKVEKKMPKELVKVPKSVRYFKSWSGVDYYQDEISPLWDHRQVIRAAKSDSRLANSYLPTDIQKLRCQAFFQALRFAPPIEALGKLLVERMISFGPYIALHLRYEKEMLAFSGCTYGLSQTESEELAMIRENTTYWKVKDIDPLEQRSHGCCPLTTKGGWDSFCPRISIKHPSVHSRRGDIWR